MIKFFFIVIIISSGFAGNTVNGQNPNLYLDSFAKCMNQYYDTSIKKDVYYHAEVQPKFPGGVPAFLRYTDTVFNSPLKELNSGLPPMTATADVIINSDGSILNPKIVKQNGENPLTDFEIEFIRVLRKMPNWNAGQCQGKAVTVIVRLDFTMTPAVASLH